MSKPASKTKKIAFLKSLDIFESLDDKILEHLLDDFEEMKLKAGDILFREGDKSDALYIVFDGKFTIEMKNTMIAERGKGEYLGEMGVVQSGPRSATVKAKNDSYLLKIKFDQFQDKFGGNSKALMGVVKTLALRAREDMATLEKSFNQLRAEKRVNSRLQNLLDDTSNEIFTLDPQTFLFKHMNERALKNLGYSLEEISQKKLSMLTPHMGEKQLNKMFSSLLMKEKKHIDFDDYLQKKNGSIYPARIRLKVDEGDTSSLIVGIVEDVTELKEMESKYLDLAFYDSLTGLPNKRQFVEYLDSRIPEHVKEDDLIEVALFEIQNFKSICNSLGSAFGDILLKAIAKKLAEQQLSLNIYYARCGENEFCGFAGFSKDETKLAIDRHVLDTFKFPVKVGEQEIYINLAIGVSKFPQNSSKADTLFEQAGTAKHFAKQEGPNAVSFYQPNMVVEEKNRLFIERDLRRALQENEFELYYQPIWNIKEKSFTRVEALIRWNHPEKGLVFPDNFIPTAEACQLMIPLGSWVFKTACLQMKAWLEQKIYIKNMAVNVSPQQLKNHDIASEMNQIIKEVGIPPEYLELEITENILMENLESAVPLLQLISSTGVGITLDDFGTGYSSLQYLQHFPLNNIKIDRTFVRDLDSEEDAQIAKAIVSLGRSFQLETIAEGIETESQKVCMESIGCDYLQGYFFCKPQKAQAATKILSS